MNESRLQRYDPEAEAVRDRELRPVTQRLCLSGDGQRDLWILVIKVDRGWRQPVLHGEHCEDRLECTGSAKKVAGGCLSCGDRNLLYSVSKHTKQCGVLRDVSNWGRRRVRVNVCYILRRCAGLLKCKQDCAACALALGFGSGDVVRISGDPAPATSA